MEAIRQYILTLVSASVVCSLVSRIIGKKQIKGITDMVCGLFIAVTMMSPWLKLEIPDIRNYTQSFAMEAETAVRAGTDGASRQMHDIIKREVESYILKEAHYRNMNVDVEVSLDVDSGIPNTVEITGETSPYERKVLSRYISHNLSIPEEAQKWG